MGALSTIFAIACKSSVRFFLPRYFGEFVTSAQTEAERMPQEDNRGRCYVVTKISRYCQTWRGRHVMSIANAAYSAATSGFYLFGQQGGHYKYSQVGESFLRGAIVSAAFCFCGSLLTLLMDNHRLPGLRFMYDQHFTLVSFTKAIMFVCKIGLILSWFVQDPDLYPAGVDKSRFCTKQGAELKTILRDTECYLFLTWNSAVGVGGIVASALLTLGTLMNIIVVDPRAALAGRLGQHVRHPHAVVFGYRVLAVTTFASSALLVCSCFAEAALIPVLRSPLASRSMILTLAILNSSAKLCINAGGRHFDACGEQEQFAQMRDVDSFRFSLVWFVFTVALCMYSVYYNTLFTEDAETVCVFFVGLVPLLFFAIVSFFLLWSTQPPRSLTF